jgi:inhibitor of KinA
MLNKITTVGDSSIICDFGENVDLDTNSQVIKLFYYIKNLAEEKKIKGLLNYTPSYNKLLINFDLEKVKSNEIIEKINSVDLSKISRVEKFKNHIIPICYDEEFALDLQLMEKKLNLNFFEITKLHCETIFFVYMIGFIPGHPYMGDMQKKLHLSRIPSPRLKVPKGSVGLAEKFCNTYTFEAPGGWNIIGKTFLEFFNIDKDNPSILSPGDTVKFESIKKSEIKNL